MKKTVIGLVGEKGGGKSAFKELLTQTLPQKKIIHVRFSDAIGDTFKIWGIEPTRANYQKMAVAMRDSFGKDAVTQAAKLRIENADADIVILDGVRWEPDVQMLRSLPNNILVYITADARLRYERTKKRGEKAGETEATFEQFLQEEQAETEKDIPRLGSRSDYTFVNNRTLENFQDFVRRFCMIYNL